MPPKPSFSILAAAVVRRLTGRFDKLKAGGVTIAATTKPKSFGFAHDRAFGFAHGHRQGSEYRIYGE